MSDGERVLVRIDLLNELILCVCDVESFPAQSDWLDFLEAALEDEVLI